MLVELFLQAIMDSILSDACMLAAHVCHHMQHVCGGYRFAATTKTCAHRLLSSVLLVCYGQEHCASNDQEVLT